jgi:hypothetical protein
MQERVADTCEDCLGLVGAARLIEPHQGLRVTRLAEKMVFLCSQCGMFWERQTLGWASVPVKARGELSE